MERGREWAQGPVKSNFVLSADASPVDPATGSPKSRSKSIGEKTTQKHLKKKAMQIVYPVHHNNGSNPDPSMPLDKTNNKLKQRENAVQHALAMVLGERGSHKDRGHSVLC